MTRRCRIVLGIFLICLLVENCQSEIHRATTLRAKSSGKNVHRHAPSVDPAKTRSNDLPTKIGYTSETWVLSIISAVLVGLSGIFPLAIIPLESGKALRKGVAAARLKLLLSFAVGGLLGDVFLHLLPEAWKHVNTDDHTGHIKIGLWVLAGLLAFLIIQKVFPDAGEDDLDDDDESEVEGEDDSRTVKPLSHLAQSSVHHRLSTKDKNTANGYIQNGNPMQNGKHQQNGKQHQENGKELKRHSTNGASHKNGATVQNGGQENNKSLKSEGFSHIKTCGWLNLMANVVDNFTHGLAVAGSYCAGTNSGLITTAIILLHEIPHEVGDFAILLRSGFDRWAAAKAQVLTATGGLLGALVALGAESASSAGDTVAWILPFTSGGFIYIALVSVVPDLLKETNTRESFKQIVSLVSGILSMAMIAFFLDDHPTGT